jgi:hypothetical protein
MRIRRIVLGGVLVAGLTIGSAVAGATTAAADHFGCTFYLSGQGYSGYIVDIGCADGVRGNPTLCMGSLRIAGVPEAIAREGCRRAAL